MLYEILYFQDHAISSHPNCFVLFGHTEIVVQEVTIGDPKREYYIEVKANAVPTKEELAHALASIEQPMEGWRTFQNWFLSRLTTVFWGKRGMASNPKMEYRGSPDSTNFAPPGNRTNTKIVLNSQFMTLGFSKSPFLALFQKFAHSIWQFLAFLTV